MFPEPAQIVLLIYVAVIIGWLGKYFYDLGYYGPAYRSRGNLQGILDYLALGFLLILIASFFYINAIANETLKIPEIIGSIPISEETTRILTIYGYLYSCLLLFVVFLIVVAMLFGAMMRYGKPEGVIIETNEGGEPLDVREIYDENEDFFFFFDNNGKWGAIKKDYVCKINSIKKDSLLDEWIKMIKKRFRKKE